MIDLKALPLPSFPPFLAEFDRKGLVIGAGAGAALLLFCLLLTLLWPETKQAPLFIPNIVELQSEENETGTLADMSELAETAKILHLVITNIHSNRPLIDSLLENMPAGISLALSPYQDNLRTRINEFRDRGRDVWVMLPSQSINAVTMREDKGPHSIHLTHPDPENIRIATTLAADTHLASGVILHPDTVMTSRPDAWRPVASALGDIGVTIADMSLHPIAGDILNHDYYLKGHRRLDETPLRPAIEDSLQQLNGLFETQDRVIASLSPYPISLKILQEWLDRMAEDMPDIVLRPLSDLVTVDSKAFEAQQQAEEHDDNHTDNGESEGHADEH